MKRIKLSGQEYSYYPSEKIIEIELDINENFHVEHDGDMTTIKTENGYYTVKRESFKCESSNQVNDLNYIKKRFENGEVERDDMEWLINKVEELQGKYSDLLNAINKAVEANNKR